MQIASQALRNKKRCFFLHLTFDLMERTRFMPLHLKNEASDVLLLQCFVLPRDLMIIFVSIFVASVSQGGIRSRYPLDQLNSVALVEALGHSRCHEEVVVSALKYKID